MSINREELVRIGYRKLGISNEFDVSPDEIIEAIGDLNRMLAAWLGYGIRLGYAPGNGASEETGIPDVAQDAVAMNLALRLAPGIGKVPSPDLKRDARTAYLSLLAQKAVLIPVQLPATTVAGAGNRRYSRQNYIIPPTDPVSAGSGGTIDGVDIE